MSEFSLNLFQNTTRAGFLFVEGTGMRQQGSLKGEGTHRGNLCVYIFAIEGYKKSSKEIWQLFNE